MKAAEQAAGGGARFQHPLPHLQEKGSSNQKLFCSKNSQLPNVELSLPIDTEAKKREMLPKTASAPECLWRKWRGGVDYWTNAQLVTFGRRTNV